MIVLYRIIKKLYSLIEQREKDKKIKIAISKYHKDFGVYNNGKNRISVIANGPSLEKDFASYYNDYIHTDCICMNYFPLTELYEIIKPRYFVAVDPDFGKEDALEKENMIELARVLEERTRWTLFIVIPEEIKKWNYFLDINNTNIRFIYINTKKIDGLIEEEEFHYSRNNVVYPKYCSATVLQTAIYMAIVLGYKKIFLSGADHSWHTDLYLDQKSNILYRKNHHFKNNDMIDYDELVGYNMESNFKSLYYVYKGHNKLKRLADFFGADIRNISSFSWIDSYRR